MGLRPLRSAQSYSIVSEQSDGQTDTDTDTDTDCALPGLAMSTDRREGEYSTCDLKGLKRALRVQPYLLVPRLLVQVVEV